MWLVLKLIAGFALSLAFAEEVSVGMNVLMPVQKHDHLMDGSLAVDSILDPPAKLMRRHSKPSASVEVTAQGSFAQAPSAVEVEKRFEMTTGSHAQEAEDDHHWAMAGCGKFNATITPMILNSSATANVRCCSTSSDEADGEGDVQEVCKSKDSDSQCMTDKNFTEAQAICASEGMEICSNEQLQELCCGTGCHFNETYVWSRDTPTVYRWTLAGCPKRFNTSVPASCDSVTEESINVRCCTTVDGDETKLDMEEYGCNADKTFEEATEICISKGFHVCSKTELESDIDCNTGCGYDGVRVWSSTECDPTDSSATTTSTSSD